MWWRKNKKQKPVEDEYKYQGKSKAEIERHKLDKKQQKKFCPITKTNCRLDCEFWIESCLSTWGYHNGYHNNTEKEELDDKIINTITYTYYAIPGRCKKE